MNQRFLIDYDNPDAGIGHSMGIINRALKIASRNQLEFAYSEDQLRKSTHDSRQWSLKHILRTLRGKKPDESHNIGDDLNRMLNPKNLLLNRQEIEARIQAGQLKVISLPKFEIHIPSNEQMDDEIYTSIDRFIAAHPEPNTAFKISDNRFGDYEYQSTRNWYIDAYAKAREQYPIHLGYDRSQFNIAIHIRRGDLLPGRQFSDLSSRMLPDAWYLAILTAVGSSTNRPIAVHIFSEGKGGQYHSEKGLPCSWKDLLKGSHYEVTEHIDSNFLESFHHLLHADILIGSKSGMSHLAGMLGDQIKVMPEMWHSYRGASKLLLVGNTISASDASAISTHIKAHLLDQT